MNSTPLLVRLFRVRIQSELRALGELGKLAEPFSVQQVLFASLLKLSSESESSEFFRLPS